VVAMLRIVVVANLLLTAVAVGDLAFWIKKASDGKKSVACKDICTNVYGTGSWGSQWKRGGAKCTCKGKTGALIDITCTGSTPLSGCTGKQTGGSMVAPDAGPQQQPSGLPSFILKCAHAATGKYAQRNGKVTADKVLEGVGDAQCSDLAMGCIRNANVKGFNVDSGSRGSVPGMCSSWAWSTDVIDFADAKAGDIAQFSSWKESKNGGGHSTGCKHTAVIVKDFDTASGALVMLDQNPSPVTQTVYHPRVSDGWKTGGKMVVYRLKSTLVDGWPVAGDGSSPSVTPAAATPDEPPACADDHEGIVQKAKEEGETITGCADAKEYCDDEQYGSIMKKFCPVTCNSCPARLFENDQYSNYVKELRKDGDVKDASKMGFMLGAFAAAALLVAMIGFGAWRMAQSSSRVFHEALSSAEEDMELYGVE